MVGLGSLARKLFGSANDRRLKALSARRSPRSTRSKPRSQALTDDAAARPHRRVPRQLAGGAELDDLLVPAFATVREAAKRTLGQRHFDVQLIGGMVLHEGAIAEMKTGEGKTLVATLPSISTRSTGKGVHVVTVNDYLARRDAEWMGQIYRFLGLTVGVIVHGLDDDERRAAYACDITYGTNNEFGFDYLRDNMKYELAHDGPARAPLRHRRRGRLDPDRRGAHAADHLRPARRPLRALQHHRHVHPAAGRRATSRSTRSSAPPASPRPATRSSRSCSPRPACSRATRSTTSRTSPSSITSTRRCAPTGCSSATRTTSSATARWSSSTSSPAA